MTGIKRALDESSHDGDDNNASLHTQGPPAVKPPSSPSTSASSSASSFRNVSACNRLGLTAFRVVRCAMPPLEHNPHCR